MTSHDAQKRFELENNVRSVGVTEADELYKYDEPAMRAILDSAPWKKEPEYFKDVRISAIALLKMVMHARSGNTIEVMGLMQGKIDGRTMIVNDAFALPVEGTETRVCAQQDGYEYMVEFSTAQQKVGRLENVIGWYHSHPSYGCWLSGIDVQTQMTNQKYQEPFLAVVIDPVRTMSAGKVELGAFRTYPEDYTPPSEGPQEYQTIPLNKIEDFGVHCKKYYRLNVSYFKSSVDARLLEKLWNKYWINTLSSTPLLTSRDYVAGQIADLAEKMENAESEIGQGARLGGGFLLPERRRDDNKLLKLQHDSRKLTVEQIHGLLAQVVKTELFNRVQGHPPDALAQ
eukprot:Rmarinus@m.25969